MVKYRILLFPMLSLIITTIEIFTMYESQFILIMYILLLNSATIYQYVLCYFS